MPIVTKNYALKTKESTYRDLGFFSDQKLDRERESQRGHPKTTWTVEGEEGIAK